MEKSKSSSQVGKSICLLVAMDTVVCFHVHLCVSRWLKELRTWKEEGMGEEREECLKEERRDG